MRRIIIKERLRDPQLCESIERLNCLDELETRFSGASEQNIDGQGQRA